MSVINLPSNPEPYDSKEDAAAECFARGHPNLPPARTLAVLVPDEDKIPCLSWVNVTDRLRRVGYLEAAPQSGPFRNGELVQFDWVPGYKYPLVIAGLGPA